MSYRPAGTVPAFSKKMRTPPPEETGLEASYLASLREKQTPVSIKLSDGEVVKGWIEYYDTNMVRLTRDDAANLFIYKHDILYISDDNGRHR
jgi:host factor-I protein